MPTRHDEAIPIANPGFFIANVMKDCPKHTVIRELIQNAIEASGPGQTIAFFKAEWHGVPKLGLYNEGAGMTMYELEQRMAIASSGKALGFDKNFGQGAKMSAGAASPYGLVYRSCHEGTVSQIWLQVQDEEDGGKLLVKVAQQDPEEGTVETVQDVTMEAVARGRPVDRDWTEAILLGRSAEDNTLTGVFLDQSGANWLVTMIAQRFYSFPAGVTIADVDVIAQRRSRLTHRRGHGLAELLIREEYSARSEDVAVQHPHYGPMTLVYGKLTGTPEERQGGPFYAIGLKGGTHICLVFRQEIYDFDRRWYHRAGAYGFAGCNENYYVHVILPDDAPVLNNNHRTAIVDHTKEPIACLQFADLIRANRPAWLINEITNQLEQYKGGEVEAALKDLAAKMRQYVGMFPVIPGQGTDLGVIELEHGASPPPDEEDPPETKTRLNGRPTRIGPGKRLSRPRPDTLQVHFVLKEGKPQWYEDMQGKAGTYEAESNTLWLSMEFPTYLLLQAWIESEWSQSEEYTMAMAELDYAYRIRAGYQALSALAFRGQEYWTPNQWQKAITPEALSAVMLDPHEDMKQVVRLRVSRRLGMQTRRKSTQEMAAI